MCESEVFQCVGLDQVVDSDAFRLMVIETEFNIPKDTQEEGLEQP